MAANYNRTAWFYDALSTLVFGKSIVNAQVALFGYIPPDSKLLIVGGGTGWVFEKIAKAYSGLQITYVEVAVNMIELSRKRNFGDNSVTFINNEIESLNLPQNFDAVLTPFFFSNFNNREVETLFAHISSQLKPGGVWLNADFQLAGLWWHKAMLQTMYLFFKLFGAVNNSSFTEVSDLFIKTAYDQISAQTFYGRFIAARVWVKSINLLSSGEAWRG